MKLKLLLKNRNAWKGGITYSNGYRCIYRPDHHSKPKYGYVYEHRLVWEEHYNCCLLPKAVVHHLDHNRTNNDILNLIAYPSHVSHLKNHKHKKNLHLENRLCYICNSNNTWYNKKRKMFAWKKFDDDKWICHNCRTRTDFHIRKYRNILRNLINKHDIL